MDYIKLTSVKHPITSVPIRGLPQYSVGTVSVWVKNPGAMSKPVVLRFRMVNIVTNGRYTYIPIYIMKAAVTLFVDVMLKLHCPVNAYHQR